jgi:hypothetical protein
MAVKEMKAPLKDSVPKVVPSSAGRPKSKMTMPWAAAFPAASPWWYSVLRLALRS